MDDLKTTVNQPVKQESRCPGWLLDERLQTALRAVHMILFEYDPAAGREFVSVRISDYLAGNYDGRLLSHVMLEDKVIHPEDLETSLRFREQVVNGGSGSMTVRLKTLSGEYHWFQMLLCPCGKAGRMIGILKDVDAEERQRRYLKYRAEYDPVSEIYNKSTFFESTEKMLHAEADKPHLLVRFDIDRFKIVNELYSISEGDKVLRHIGNTLRALQRPGETYGRLGNDVFCMCLNRPEPDAVELIETLEQRINDYPMTFQFVLSVGILRIPHYDGEAVNILCDRAALAQRTVKGSYINSYAFYEKRMGSALNREHQITGYMRHALDSGQFQVYLQPQFDMNTRRIVGAEALARWAHPDEGMIMPGDFIPLFERNGFIIKLDEYIWGAVGRLIRGWLNRGIPTVPISVNVSRTHLYDPRFCEKVLSINERYQVPPSLLEMEITESAYIENPETLYGVIGCLQKEGHRILMDDFGSGYSSLNMLKDIPVDVIKIDLNFLKEARRGANAGRSVLRGTIRLIQDMDLPIIVEGVETKEQTELLTGMGCTCAQGYYYARPMPAAAFENLLLEQKSKLSP